MSDKITPRTLKGFRDYLPEAMIPREKLIDTAKQVYRSYGFSPIDTPALEHLDILLGKGSEETDKQLFKFEHGKRPVGMRFDLTVPLARFVAQHIQELGTPFKRYHIATVWRGENTQRGRYREFMQCDFDTIGTTSTTADIETVLVVNDLLSAIGFEKFTIRVNNRLVLSGLLEKEDLADQTGSVLRALDKLPKIGAEKVAAELTDKAGVTASQADSVLKLAGLSGSNDAILEQLAPLVAGNETGERGLRQLQELIEAVTVAGTPTGRLQVDVSIARGLDYYTGMVIETFLDELPEMGSVCSGGRYDNLAELYTSQQLPGVGASLGLDRLLAAMEELGRLEAKHPPADVFIPLFTAERRNDYLRIAATLRNAGLSVEMFPEAKKLGKQLKYADQKGFPTALIIGDDEFAASQCQVKNLSTGDSSTVALSSDCSEVASEIQRQLKTS